MIHVVQYQYVYDNHTKNEIAGLFYQREEALNCAIQKFCEILTDDFENRYFEGEEPEGLAKQLEEFLFGPTEDVFDTISSWSSELYPYGDGGFPTGPSLWIESYKIQKSWEILKLEATKEKEIICLEF